MMRTVVVAGCWLRLYFYHLRAESLPGLHTIVDTGRLPLLTNQDVEDVTFGQLYHHSYHRAMGRLP